MKTGIILEIEEHYLTLLTPDGQFLRAKNIAHPYQIGQEIQFVPIEVPIHQHLKWFSSANRKALAAAVMAIMIGASTFIPFYQSNQVYAYMTIDDGSSIELEVNKELEVIGIIPYNDKGEQIVNSIKDWKKQELSTVSEKIITEMEKQAVGDGNIVLSSTILADETKPKIKQKLKQEMSAIQTVVSEEHKATVTHVEGTEVDREKAKKQGVTVGQLKEKEMGKNNKEKQQEKKSKKEENDNQNLGPGNVEVNPNRIDKGQAVTNNPGKSQDNKQKNDQKVDSDKRTNQPKKDQQLQNQAPQKNNQSNNQQTDQNRQKVNNVQQSKQEYPNEKRNIK